MCSGGLNRNICWTRRCWILSKGAALWDYFSTLSSKIEASPGIKTMLPMERRQAANVGCGSIEPNLQVLILIEKLHSKVLKTTCPVGSVYKLCNSFHCASLVYLRMEKGIRRINGNRSFSFSVFMYLGNEKIFIA